MIVKLYSRRTRIVLYLDPGVEDCYDEQNYWGYLLILRTGILVVVDDVDCRDQRSQQIRGSDTLTDHIAINELARCLHTSAGIDFCTRRES